MSVLFQVLEEAKVRLAQKVAESAVKGSSVSEFEVQNPRLCTPHGPLASRCKSNSVLSQTIGEGHSPVLAIMLCLMIISDCGHFVESDC